MRHYVRVGCCVLSSHRLWTANIWTFSNRRLSLQAINIYRLGFIGVGQHQAHNLFHPVTFYFQYFSSVENPFDPRSGWTEKLTMCNQLKQPLYHRLALFSLVGLIVPFLCLYFAIGVFEPSQAPTATRIFSFLIFTLWISSVCNAVVLRVTLTTIGLLAIACLLLSSSLIVIHNAAPAKPAPPLPLNVRVNLGKCDWIEEVRACPGFKGYIGATKKGHVCTTPGQSSIFNTSLGNLASVEIGSDSLEAYMRIHSLAGQLYRSV